MNFGNLGIALGAGVDEANIQREQSRKDQEAERQQKEFGQKEKDWARQDTVDKAQAEAVARYKERIARFQKGDHEALAQELVDQHNNSTYMGDSKSTLVRGNDGNLHIIAYPDGTYDGTKAVVVPVTPDLIKQHADEMYLHELQTADPRSALHNMESNRDYGVKDRTAKAAETTANAHTEKNRVDRESNNNWFNVATGSNAETSRHNQAIEAIQRAQAGGSGQRAPTAQWVPFATDLDGQPVFINQHATDPSQAFMRADRQPVQDTAGVYAKFTGAKPGLDPAARKEFTTALDGLGPRPQPKVGFFGTKDESAGKNWDAARQQIYSNHGVPFSSQGSQTGIPAITQDAPPQARAQQAAPVSNNRVVPGMSAVGLPMNTPSYRVGTRDQYSFDLPTLSDGFTNTPSDLGYSLTPNVGLPRRMR